MYKPHWRARPDHIEDVQQASRVLSRQTLNTGRVLRWLAIGSPGVGEYPARLEGGTLPSADLAAAVGGALSNQREVRALFTGPSGTGRRWRAFWLCKWIIPARSISGGQ
jgi:hypothetical protein